MHNFLPIYRRELWLAFTTPLAATLLVIYLLLTGILTLTVGGFIETNQANLNGLFLWQPWLFLFLGAALGMGEWAEEYRTGTAELLFTLPVSLPTLVFAKFLASLTILALALVLTTPFAFVCEWLGKPDWGPILTGYLGCLLCAAFFVALGQATSVCTRTPFASCLTAITIGLAFLLAGFRPFHLLLIKWNCPQLIIEKLAALSLTSHFEELPKGLLTLRTLYFFFAATTFPLTFILLVLRRRHLPKNCSRFTQTILLWICLAFLFPVWESLPGQLDATAEKRFTLDEGTRIILKDLATPVTIDFYYSRNFPELTNQTRNYAAHVEALLAALARQNPAKVTLTTHDPADEEAQQAARNLGLQPHIGSMGDLWYLGAVVTPQNTAHPPQILPDFQPAEEDQLEYQLIRAIDATQRTAKRRIGLYSTLPVLEHYNSQTKRLLPTWWSLQQLERQFTIVPLDDPAALPDNLDLLMLVHPKNLKPEQEKAIAEYIHNGGALIALLDPLSRADVQLQGRFAPPQPSTLPTLLQEWGLTFHHTKVVADRTLATPMTNTRRGMETLPTLVTLRNEQLCQTSPLTAHLENLTMFCAGAFDITPPEDLKVTPLVTTTTDAQLLAIYEAQRNAGEILTDFQPDGTIHNLALLIEAPNTKAILLGDVDFLHNSLCINKSDETDKTTQPALVSDNATFLTNAAEYLCADARLLRLRSRGRQPRTFQRIEALARQTEQRIQELDAETYRQNEDLRQQFRQIAAQDSGDSPEIQAKLTELENEDARRQEALRLRQRQELKLLRLTLDCLERKVAFLCVLLAPSLLTLFALVMAWKRRA